MKLKFKNQDFQTDAVNAVVDLFSGQENMRSTFTLQGDDQFRLFENEFGIGNRIIIDDKVLLANMNEIQRRNNLPLTTADWKEGFSFPISLSMKIPARQTPQFSIEMETGTGKT